MTPITGHTRWYAHLGDPIAQVKTPAVFNAFFAEHGIDACVVPIRVSAADLPRVVDGLRGWQNLLGIGVTITHKQAIAALVDELTPEARLCGATNVIKRRSDGSLLGAQFDGPGFAVGLGKHGVDVAGANVLLAGAGGSARAIAFELARRGAASLTITNRTAAKADRLASDVHAAFAQVRCGVAGPEVAGYDLLVNATKLGMQADGSIPFQLERLSAGQAVADIVMEPAETPLLRRASETGCTVVPGRAMLEGQLEVTARFFGLQLAPQFEVAS